jgi:UDP-N-acetylmuramate--alanine ligase
VAINPFATTLGKVKRIHFIGIGGVGMCGIAEVLNHEGYVITGSDRVSSAITARLASKGIKIFKGHSAQNVIQADVVVVSSAIKEDNEEVKNARENNIPVIPRAEMLAEIMRNRYGIAVSGTHGKTTTTSLMAHVLAYANLDPSFVIGGKLNKSGKTAMLGESKYIVVEADESDASFLYLKPVQAVVTNIDSDHMQTYNGNVKTLEETFINFLHHLPFYGLASLCIDDPGVRHIIAKIERPIITYGFSEEADVRATNWQQDGLKNNFSVVRKNKPTLDVSFSLPGRHNVENVLAVISSLQYLPISDDILVKAINSFDGVGRRFQLLGNVPFSRGQALLIDDYGHHPREISSTIEAIRHVWPEKRLVLAFQPHRYSRTKALFQDFIEALSQVETLLLLDVFAAGETKDKLFNSQTMAEEIRKKNTKLNLVETNLTDLSSCLDLAIEDDDILLLQGAGNIGAAAQDLVKNQQKVLS